MKNGSDIGYDMRSESLTYSSVLFLSSTISLRELNINSWSTSSRRNQVYNNFLLFKLTNYSSSTWPAWTNRSTYS